MTGLAGEQRATLVLGFGRTPARRRRRTARPGSARLGRDRGALRPRLAPLPRGLKAVPASAAAVRRQYLASALVLAAAEDKLNPGALVASPSAPWVWGDEVKDLSSPSGAYHLVWSRDAYQFGTALWAMGDRAAARRSVDWLFGVQQKPDGSFPQNSDVAGHAGVVRAPARRGGAADRAGPPRRQGRRRDLPRREAGRAASSSASVTRRPGGGRRTRRRSAGRTSPATRPTRSPPRSPAWSAPPTSPGRTATAASAPTWLAAGRPVAGEGQAVDGHHQRPAVSSEPYFLRITKDGDPNRGTAYAHRRRRAVRRRPAARWSTRASSTWCGSGIGAAGRPGGAEHARRWSTTSCGWTRRTGRSGTASASTGTARRATAASGRSPSPTPSRRSVAAGRC